MKCYDAIIIGGGILGCAVGYELEELGLTVIILEKNFLTSGSTGRCISGVRQQFSTPTSIRLAMESVKLFEEMGEEVEWYSGGYLFLAQKEEEKEKYLHAMKIQKKQGLEVEFVDNKEIKEIVPGINTSTLIGGVYCPTDGEANPFLVVKRYARKIKEKGGEILTQNKVVHIKKEGNIFFVTTSKGLKFSSPILINATGAWLNEVNKLMNVPPLPLRIECHEAFITESLPPLFSPMVVSYSPNCYFQQLHYTQQIIGCYTPTTPREGREETSTYSFLPTITSRILKLIPTLQFVKVLRSWVGWYTLTPDGNPIVGETELPNFWVVGGASGHGFMFGPALGKEVAQMVVRRETKLITEEILIGREFKKGEELG